MTGLRFEALRGEQIAGHVDALADLRIAVFREWPYLYEGTREYEARYLDVYLRCARSLAVLVWEGSACVAASTALPLTDAAADAQAPFVAAGHSVDRIDYFGESVVLAAYRGRGLGVRFFELREAHAREHGLAVCAFCAVERRSDDPRRPHRYVPNDAFWSRRGYRKDPAMVTQFSWPDIGDRESTPKPMTFWLRDLTQADAPP